MEKLSLKNEKVHFKAIYEDAEHVDIPEEILNGKVPKEAKYEIEHYLNSIVKKYNLSPEELIPSKPRKASLSPSPEA